MSDLLSLADRVASAPALRPDRTLNREVALAVGWARLTPSEGRKSYPTWYHPDDVRNGKPVFDSLHGTDVWREPLDYLGSLDAAMSLVPESWVMRLKGTSKYDQMCWTGDGERPQWAVSLHIDTGHTDDPFKDYVHGHSATPALALCAAALRARARSASADGGE